MSTAFGAGIEAGGIDKRDFKVSHAHLLDAENDRLSKCCYGRARNQAKPFLMA